MSEWKPDYAYTTEAVLNARIRRSEGRRLAYTEQMMLLLADRVDELEREAEPQHEVVCPNCSATICARMADAGFTSTEAMNMRFAQQEIARKAEQS